MFRYNVQAAASASGLSAIQALNLRSPSERAEPKSSHTRVAAETRIVQSNRAPSSRGAAHRF